MRWGKSASGPVAARLGWARWGEFSPRAALWTALAAMAIALTIYAPVLYHMTLHWKLSEDNSHGFIIVPLSLYFAWERRHELAGVTLRGSWWGLVPLGLGAASLTVGRLGVELTTMRWAFVLTLIGLVVLLLGIAVFRVLAFPLLFLFLMVPLPQSLVNMTTFPLQLTAARFAVESLHLVRVPALLEGNIIHLANAELFVAEACSGLRSIMALVTLSVLFAYFFARTHGERLIIIASTIPIAVLVNAMRVALMGILTHRYGESASGGFIHDFQGVITFSVAFALLLVEARVLARFWPTDRNGHGAGEEPA